MIISEGGEVLFITENAESAAKAYLIHLRLQDNAVYRRV